MQFFKSAALPLVLLYVGSSVADVTTQSCSFSMNPETGDLEWSITFGNIPGGSISSVCGNFGGDTRNNGNGALITEGQSNGTPVVGSVSCNAGGSTMQTSFTLGGQLGCGSEATTISNAITSVIGDSASVDFSASDCGCSD
ncbi:hypothetical protein NA57DRAFT_56376 [Rhizodiscina lignyota]|uniref:Uncharacterized protein n=1 Tax=Rhizodiscina lignyota TaxID=1504668 RepID=A0A9P4IDA7_9PEZI|nr:hypothetical protein NA57DRAFT_56376 [Rhizodiscina lignyota]